MKQIDPEKETERIIDFVKQTFQTAGFTDAVIGLSGGVDSAVSLCLATRALGLEHVYPILLPYGPLNTRGVLDAMELIEKIKIPMTHVVRIDIKPAVDAIVRIDPFMDCIRKGNIMARVRMTYLFDQAKKHHALVMGTENKSEHELGYFTRFGDEASDVEPIVHLYKTQVVELARFLEIPQSIIMKPPSADLWPEQTDEGELGFTYKEADEILFQLIDGKMGKEETSNIFEKDMVIKISTRMKQNRFKNKLPYSLSML
ncbi:MAG: NAD+ synthase [Candidatus Gottesmanbacteria bacterium]